MDTCPAGTLRMSCGRENGVSFAQPCGVCIDATCDCRILVRMLKKNVLKGGLETRTCANRNVRFRPTVYIFAPLPMPVARESSASAGIPAPSDTTQPLAIHLKQTSTRTRADHRIGSYTNKHTASTEILDIPATYSQQLLYTSTEQHGVRKAGAGEQLLPQSFRKKFKMGLLPKSFVKKSMKKQKCYDILHKFLLNFIKDSTVSKFS